MLEGQRHKQTRERKSKPIKNLRMSWIEKSRDKVELSPIARTQDCKVIIYFVAFVLVLAGWRAPMPFWEFLNTDSHTKCMGSIKRQRLPPKKAHK